MRTPREALIKQLQRQHDGEPWHGPSRETVLEGITASMATWRPAKDAHSIWALVLHMRSWTREVMRRLEGSVPGEPADGDWPAVPAKADDAAWQATLASLQASHEELIALVKTLSEDQLNERVKARPGEQQGIPNRAMLYSLAEHDIYHTGQVAMLKRLAAADRSS